MLQVEEDNGSLVIPPFGSGLKLLYKNKNNRNQRVARIGPGPKKNHYYAYFEQDDVDFEIEMDNSSCKDRSARFVMEAMNKKHAFGVRPNQTWKIETLESNGKKLHFIRQSGEKGKSLVSSTASTRRISRRNASTILSQIKFQINYEVRKFVIRVKDEGGKTTKVHVTSQTTLDELQEKIAREIRHPVDNFSVSLNGKEFDDYNPERTLDELKINENCKLICEKIKFPVHVKVKGRKRSTVIKVSSWDLVQDLKKWIEEKVEISAAQQKLFFNEKELFFNKSALGRSGITRNSILELDVIENFPLKIKIVPSPNKTITIPVCSRNTIRDVMDKIEKQEGIPIGQQTLYLHGSPIPLISFTDIENLVQDIRGLNEKVTVFLGVKQKSNKKATHGNNNDDGQKAAKISKIQKKIPHECETGTWFPITIKKRMDGTSINLNVCSSESVRDMKEKIREKTGITVENQKIMYRLPNEDASRFVCASSHLQLELYDSFPLELYEIKEKSELALIFRCVGETGTINVKTLTGKTIELPFFPTETTSDLKSGIEERERIPPYQYKLIYAGRQLEDERTLPEYWVRVGCTLHMVLVLRGGGHGLCKNPSCSICASEGTTADFSERGAITFGGKSTQTFSSCSFDADESIEIEPFIIELRLAGVPLIP